jgi:plastocyanin
VPSSRWEPIEKPVGRSLRKNYPMANLRQLPMLAAVLAMVLALAACGGSGKSNESKEGTTMTIGGQAVESHGTKDVSGETGKVEVEMYDKYFEPTVLKGTPGQKVTMELKNEGKVAHTFTVTEQSVDQEIQPGDEAEADVTFPESGELTFICKFHESSGMVGALEASS